MAALDGGAPLKLRGETEGDYLMNNNNGTTFIPSAPSARAAKYSVFHNKIQDLPHILCAGFLYYEKGVGPLSVVEKSHRFGAQKRPFMRKRRAP